MKFFLSILTFLLLSLAASGQTYMRMMHDPSYSFYEVVDSAEAWFSEHSTGKGSGYKDYMRWKSDNESRYYPTGNRQSTEPGFAMRQYRAIQAQDRVFSKGSFDQGWVDLGPYRADNITSHYSAGIGRVECFYVDPQDPKLLYMGSRSGGFWRSSDEGQNWINSTDTLTASGVNCMAVRPGSSDSILINVRNANDGISHGVYRSTDGGFSWTLSAFNPVNTGRGGWGNYFQVYKLVYHPRVADLVFIGTSNGLYRSTDDLASWERIMSGNITDIEFHPEKDSTIYLVNSSTRGWIYRSTDLGASFQQAGSMLNNTSTPYIAVTPQDADLVFAASSNGVFRSRNEGSSFALIAEPDEACAGFALSDVDSNVMLFGYVDIEASTDGGQTFEQITSWSSPFSASYVHADVRTLECLSGTFYVGTDGYFCKSSDNGETWTKLNVGTGIRENYRMGVSQSNWRVSMSGSQDNGTSILDTGGWIEWNGGDGMEAIVQPLNEAMMVGSWQYGTRNRTVDRGQSRQGISTPLSGSTNADWIAPMLLDPSDQMEFLHFSSFIHRAKDFGDNWVQEGSPGIGIIKIAAIANNNPNIILVCRNDQIRLTTDGGQTFTNINNTALNHALTYASFDPNDDSTIVITYNSYVNNGRKVFITHDLGANWENITYNLGSMPVLCATIDHSDSSYIYVGAEIGVFYKSMNGDTWYSYDENLPRVAVKELEIHYGSNTLKAATWGRGIWENSLVGRNSFPSIVETHISTPPSPVSPSANSDQFVRARILYDGQLSSVFVRFGTDSMDLTDRLEMEFEGDDQWVSTGILPRGAEGSRIYFKVYAVGQVADTSTSYRFMYSLRSGSYCMGRGAAGTGADYITLVRIGDFDFSSNKELYYDATSIPVDVDPGQTIDLLVQLNYHFDLDTVGAWLDINADNVFDASEFIAFSAIDDQHQATASFTVPQASKTDDTLRLRVRTQYGGAPQPCGEFGGEVEDYALRIQGVNSIHSLNSAGIRIYPNPGKGPFVLEWIGTGTGTLDVYSASGQLIHSENFEQSNSLTLDQSFPSGTYLLVLSSEHGQVQQTLLVQ